MTIAVGCGHTATVEMLHRLGADVKAVNQVPRPERNIGRPS
jgi:hypothetical protein